MYSEIPAIEQKNEEELEEHEYEYIVPDSMPEKVGEDVQMGKTLDEKGRFNFSATKDHGSMDREARMWENSSPTRDYVSFKKDEDEYLKPMSFRLPVQK